MKITIYELLGLVKDDKAPLKFKVNDEIYEYDEDRGYICRHIGGWTYLYEDLNKGYIFLNDEVEILEEEKKETKPLTKKDIEAIGYACGEIQKCFTNGWTKSLENKPLEEEHKIPEKLNIQLNSDDENKVNYYTATNLECDLAFKINEILDYLEVNNGIMDKKSK